MLVEDRDAYDATLTKLRALPAKTVHPGHGGPFPAERLPRRV
jgi:glyoxylase-like metal-dependent hydrolase (beta-lactamase superfamily II)